MRAIEAHLHAVWDPEPVTRVRRPSAGAGRRRRSWILTIARVSHMQWFFVNLYEAVVGMPGRLADEHDSGSRPPHRGPLAPGSPARYHVPAAPVVAGSSLAALVTGLRHDGDRPALAVAAGSSLVATALTGYLVRTVNLRLLDDGPPIGGDERQQLLDRWHGVNRLRLALLAVASIALERAASCDGRTGRST
jgi:hypothetical protein